MRGEREKGETSGHCTQGRRRRGCNIGFTFHRPPFGSNLQRALVVVTPTRKGSLTSQKAVPVPSAGERERERRREQTAAWVPRLPAAGAAERESGEREGIRVTQTHHPGSDDYCDSGPRPILSEGKGHPPPYGQPVDDTGISLSLLLADVMSAIKKLLPPVRDCVCEGSDRSQ